MLSTIRYENRSRLSNFNGNNYHQTLENKNRKNSIINEKCHLDARGGIIIHNNVSISIYTVLITGSHNAQSPTFEFLEMPIHIEDNVWIGARSILLPGSYLKTSCLIGAGSTVRKGEYQIDGFYSGVPATYVKQRNLKGLYQQQWNPWFR